MCHKLRIVKGVHIQLVIDVERDLSRKRLNTYSRVLQTSGWRYIIWLYILDVEVVPLSLCSNVKKHGAAARKHVVVQGRRKQPFAIDLF